MKTVFCRYIVCQKDRFVFTECGLFRWTFMLKNRFFWNNSCCSTFYMWIYSTLFCVKIHSTDARFPPPHSFTLPPSTFYLHKFIHFNNLIFNNFQNFIKCNLEQLWINHRTDCLPPRYNSKWRFYWWKYLATFL